MNRLFRITLISLSAIVTIYFFLGLFGVLRLYRLPSTANEPNLKLNSYLFASNLVTPEIGDFICFKYGDSIMEKAIYVFRLSGTQGDTIQMKEGVFYINQKNMDENLNLNYNFEIDKMDLDQLKEKKIIDEEAVFRLENGKYFTHLDKDTAEKFNLLNSKILKSRGEPNETMKKVFNKNWNFDNFGPIIVPENKTFVLGDNRHNSMDSRYFGFIDKNSIVGVIILKL